MLERRELLTTFYVDGPGGDGPGGSDANNGRSLTSAFATIQRAANFAGAGDTIEIRGGAYREDTVNLPRSGTATQPITFRAFNNEEVVFSSADVVTGWTLFDAVNDIWVANLSQQGAGFDVNTDNNRAANTLFANGELKFEAREQAEVDPIDIDNWGEVRQGDLTTTTLRSDDLIGFGNDFWNGAKIRFHRNDFTLETRTIADYNSATGTVTFDTSIGAPNLKQTNGFYIFDTFEALDRAGEWYRGQASDGSGQANLLYYKAEPGQNPNDPGSLEIEFKQRDYAFNASSRDYIHIEGITFRGLSIRTNTSTDFNTYANNTFYAYDKANFGRLFIEGNNNTIRDSTLRQTWGTTFTVRGDRNAIVNNLIEEHGYNGVAKVLVTRGSETEEFLFSHNTVRRFAEAFTDSYPSRSEFAYNVFEEGGLLSFDTGVFDADGRNSDSSQSIFRNNVFRNTDSRGIYEAFYGRNNNAVIHNNLFYDFNSVFDRASLRTTGTNFRQVYHNTVISTVERAPLGNPDASAAIQTRYNNNLQISIARQESFGVDLRGNFNYTPDDFVDFAGNDFQLAPESGAIDAGILLPGINDDFLDDAPDAGAFEFGAEAWVAGHDFADPPEAVFGWVPLPGTNLYDNGTFTAGIADWSIVSGSPNSRDRNSFNLAASGAPLTGIFRTQSVELTPGEAISRQFTGLQPNTTYTFGAAARVANEIEFNTTSGATTGTHRGVTYATNLSGGDWIRFNSVNFGESGQFDQFDLLHIRNLNVGAGDPFVDANGNRLSLEDITVQVRLDSPTGTLLAEINDFNDGNTLDRWRADRADFLVDVSGTHNVFLSVQGANAENIAIGSVRLLKEKPPTTDLLTARASSLGAPSVSVQFGATDWREDFEEFTFTTGPTSTSINLQFRNNGRLNAYLDRLYLIEGFSTRGGVPLDASADATGSFLSAAGVVSNTPNLTDGDRSTQTVTGNVPGAWVEVDLGNEQAIYGLELVPASTQPNRLSNFRVSVWSADPSVGGTELWSQDYLTDGVSLTANESLYVQGDAFGRDGVTHLNDVNGRIVRVELIGPNNTGNNTLAIGEISVLGFDEQNVGVTDSNLSQSSTEGELVASNAGDGDRSTRSATLPSDLNSWIQTQLSQGLGIGQIQLVNHDGSNFDELSNFTVTVWDGDPNSGGELLWQNAYFPSGSVGRGATFTIDGSEIDSNSTRRLASVHTARVVRVQLNGQNNQGNGRLSLAELRITPASAALPINNLAQRGVAEQSNDFYGDAGAVGTTFGFASRANDGSINTLVNFTSARNIPNQWWQVDLQQTTPIDQIVIFNRQDSASRLDDFDVEVWNDDPDNGGQLLWDRRYQFSSSADTLSTNNTIGAGGALFIDGTDTDGSGANAGLRLDQVQDARYVRVQLNDSDILSLVEVQVWAPDTSVRLPVGQASVAYDLGTEQSPVQNGAVRVSPTTFGDVTWTGDIAAADRGVGNNFNRDFIAGTTPAAFNHLLDNGRYRVTLNTSDPANDLDNLFVQAEGIIQFSDIDRPAGQNQTFNFVVDVDDGELNLVFGDADTVDPAWAVNRIVLTRLPSGSPTITPDGGVVIAGTEATIENADTAGQVYFTTDGSDPRLPDGSINPNAIAAGGTATTTITLQDFEGVTAPAIPIGWTATTTNGSSNWTTSASSGDGPGNGATVNNIGSVADVSLTSSPFSVDAGSRRITFRNSYDTEFFFDGAVLEVSINSGAFIDIEAAGGVFVEGGYNGTLSGEDGSPFSIGQRAWTGDSGGYITTTFDLPATAIDGSVQLRWRFGSDEIVAGNGWSIDTVQQITTQTFSPTFTINADTTLTARTLIGDVWSDPATASFVIGVTPGDFDTDGDVDGNDLAQWQADYGQNGNSDADQDGDSDGNDFLIWQRNYNGGNGQIAAVVSNNSVDGLSSEYHATATVGGTSLQADTSDSSRLASAKADTVDTTGLARQREHDMLTSDSSADLIRAASVRYFSGANGTSYSTRNFALPPFGVETAEDQNIASSTDVIDVAFSEIQEDAEGHGVSKDWTRDVREANTFSEEETQGMSAEEIVDFVF